MNVDYIEVTSKKAKGRKTMKSKGFGVEEKSVNDEIGSV